MKKFIAACMAAVAAVCFTGCGQSAEPPAGEPTDIVPQTSAGQGSGAQGDASSSIAGYFICADCLQEFDTQAALDGHACAQDAYRTDALRTMEFSLAAVANLFEIEGVSYPAEDVVNDYAQSYLFIYANLHLADRAAEAGIQSDAFEKFIALSEDEVSRLLDAAFGGRFQTKDLEFGEYSPVVRKDGAYYIGAGDVIPASAEYQGFGVLGGAETQEYLYGYSVTTPDGELTGSFSVELIPSGKYEGALSLAGVYLG